MKNKPINDFIFLKKKKNFCIYMNNKTAGLQSNRFTTQYTSILSGLIVMRGAKGEGPIHFVFK